MIKLNWSRGKNLGLSLIYFGIMGFIQVLFITIAQYGMGVGSKYATILMPIGAVIATFYSIIILYESQTSMKQYRGKRTYRGKKKGKNTSSSFSLDTIIDFIKNPLVKPVISVLLSFTIFFLISLGITSSFLEDQNSIFVICENAGSIGTLIFATYQETDINRKTRR